MTETAPAAPEEERPFLLDTSAILTFIEDEEGADHVGEALSRPTTLVPWTVLLETHYITQREQGQAEADRRFALLKQLGLTMLWEVDEPMLLTASRIKAEQRLSFADSIIAAYAIRAGAVLMHKDPEYEALRGSVPMEILPYKVSGR
ncbi:MAG: type II toxin-antitoxin system VapC family toxin [Actinobacteria bacterium]|jgi:predicted nucleic acid-binding protein|nr:type II toxin-antitoxin system VapC family toxin [Actinomycetota bacterium]